MSIALPVAAQVPIQDAGGFYTSTEVEGALQELGPLIAGSGITQLTGDVTAGPGSGSQAATIANNAVTTAKILDAAVTLAKMADLAQARIVGRADGAGTGVPTSLTGSQIAVITQGDGTDVDATGFRGLPQNSQSANYTTVAADAGKSVTHPSGAGAGDTFTIAANASVAYEIGTAITFVNMDSNPVSIAITSDTLVLAGVGTTGTRTLAANSYATALKVASTTWLISGPGLT